MSTEFLFHANALGFSGRIDSPFREVIPVQAASAIPEAGGYATARVENFRFHEFVSFKSAWSQVTGVESLKRSGTYSTLASAVVEGLNILDMVTVDRIVVRITSDHPGDGEASIRLVGSSIEGLRIAGCHVHVELDVATFDELDRLSKLQSRCAKDADFRSKLAKRLYRGQLDQIPDSKHRTRAYFAGLAAPVGDEGFDRANRMRCSLVSSLETDRHVLQPCGHTIEIDGFGLVRIAELNISDSTRSLTMLRVDLGCAVTGSFTSGSGAGNGRPW